MIKSLFNFIRLIFVQKQVIASMAKREVKTRYVGSLLGFVWTFLHPMMLIFIFWLVFSVGFRVKPTNNAPFVVWLTAGMAIWLAFSDIVNGSAGIVVENANLVTKTRFHSQILPFIRIVSCLVTHVAFLTILFALLVFQKMPFSICYLQFLYYLFGMATLALGIGWAISALNVFIRDVGQLVAILLQFGFWMTPIFWDMQMMPAKVQTFLKFNPMYYIVQGYRESFIYFVPFWEHPYQTAYFWAVAITMLAGGALIFKRLKPHFGDVL